MITTVTVTTAGVTTVAATALALIAILAMLALLIQKEIIGGLEGPRARRLSRALNVVIVPLLIVFAATVAYKVSEVLR